jgi:hypothetical protein
VALYGDATFALKVHVVKHLGLRIAGRNGVGHLQKSVGQGALTVVNVGNNAEISDVLHRAAKVLNKG